MSFTFKSRLGKLKMGSTSMITELDTTSSLNFASLKITTGLNLNYAGAGILHVYGTGSVTSGLLVSDDIAPLAVTSEKLQDSIVLSGVPTATTANTEDRSFRIATTEFVQNAITNVLGSEPDELLDGLNTLQELAAAIGNDATFFTTIRNDIAKKVSLNGNESVNGTKTFTSLPVLPSLSTVGIVHNNSNGILSTDLIQTDDIANGVVTIDKIANGAITFDKIENGAIIHSKIADLAIKTNNLNDFCVINEKIGSSAISTTKISNYAVTFDKLDSDLVLPINTTLEILEEGEAEIVPQSLVTVALLVSNKPLIFPQVFFHITEADITLDANENAIYTLGAYTKYILEPFSENYLHPIKIYLPPITVEGMFFSITNKSGVNIQIITDNTDEEKMYNFTLAPYDGDPELEIDNHRTFDVISQITRNERSWQARFF
jgi:hypothetical protein